MNVESRILEFPVTSTPKMELDDLQAAVSESIEATVAQFGLQRLCASLTYADEFVEQSLQKAA